LGTPDDIYRRPVDRFVASFVGDVNVLRGQLERSDSDIAVVALGPAQVPVPARTLRGAMPGAELDLFVRPEDLRVAEPGEAATLNGTVAAQIYQGGPVDLYVEVPEAASGRVLLRLPGQQAMSRWPLSTPIALAVGEAVAFGPAAETLTRSS